MASNSLKGKVISAFRWSFIERSLYQIIHFSFSIIIARLLDPSHFGLIGMISIFIAISTLIIDGGYGHAIIRDNNAKNKEFSAVFFFNIFISCSLYLVLFITAPYIASFYEEPSLKAIIRIISLTIITNSFCIVQDSILIKELKFKKISFINIGSIIVSGIVSISVALSGGGVWALVFQQLSLSIVKVFLYWYFSKWKPTLDFRISTIKKYHSFTFTLLSIGLLNVIYDNIYNLLIGKIYSTQSLGYYTQAMRMQQIPTQNITSIVMKVSFPALSAVQEDNEKMRSYYKQIFTILFFIITPIMLILMVVAQPFFEIILTKKWLSSVSFFQLLCIIGITYPLNTVLGNVYKVKNRLITALYIRISEKIAITLVILITMKINIMTMIIGLVAVNILLLLVNMIFAGNLIQYNIFQQFRDLITTFLVASFSIFVAYLIGFLIDNNLLKLVLQLLVGSIFYLALSYIFNKKILMKLLTLL